MMSDSAQDDRINYNAFYPKTFLFLVFIAVFSHRRRSLQLSGAFTAILMGHLTMANPNPIFGGALLSFFALGTFATKYKQKIKAGLVDESELQIDPTKKQLVVGPSAHLGRDWKQVLCNSWFGALCALLYSCSEPNSSLSSKLSGFIDHFEPTHTGPLRKALISAALAYWAGCAGDTVPAGTNGAVSFLGLTFSALGGFLVGGVSSFVGDPHEQRGYVILSCALYGLLCSIVDSVLGATLQQTVYSKKEKRVVAKSQMKLGGSREIVVICGHDLLTNNQVNLVSSTTTGILAGLLSYYSIMP
ncbi:hypothetical protein Pst134EA_007295 [Puccinia striiformis f. sp. tritici]|uniref:hypothetical protein n=1 Tax=Puccinia striiformis f. sp. tritici TaxID=168172 RepID=UPI002007B9C9|nr:hypothetical protein Pst134EA_007295 [Puccinia striiformis f. sp. tritici]KAH9470031.1 hypothetical protein Pst134EA_007295 [Puccinia striiformis f. sp. tritici]